MPPSGGGREGRGRVEPQGPKGAFNGGDTSPSPQCVNPFLNLYGRAPGPGPGAPTRAPGEGVPIYLHMEGGSQGLAPTIS